MDNSLQQSDKLVPAHGDAHAGNLIASPGGWLWIDFEDVSLMPEYWDLASYTANKALFGGLEEPTLSRIMASPGVVTNRKSFADALVARVLMSTLGNLTFALERRGNLNFALNQVSRAEGFIRDVERRWG